MNDALAVTVRIPARLTPDRRDELIVGPLGVLVEHVSASSRIASVETVASAVGEPMELVIGLDVHLPDAEQLIAAVLDLEAGMPRGSTVEINDKAATFGELEGLALYLNGTDLPDEVYATSDLAAIVGDLRASLEGVGEIWAVWQGPTETALYVYGRDAAAIEAVLVEQQSRIPLMQGCRMVELIAPVTESTDAAGS